MRKLTIEIIGDYDEELIDLLDEMPTKLSEIFYRNYESFPNNVNVSGQNYCINIKDSDTLSFVIKEKK